MAGGDDSVMWLRVKDEDIDAAELLRVKESTTGSGKKRWFVCTGTLYKGKDDHMREYSRAQKKVVQARSTDTGSSTSRITARTSATPTELLPGAPQRFGRFQP